MKAAKSGKRQVVLDAALKLFGSAHDVRKVSVEDIAKQAGVSPTTIYNQFGTREKLVTEVVREITLLAIERNRTVVHSKMPFAEKLMTIMGGKMALAKQLDAEIINKMVSQDKAIAGFIDKVFHEEIKPLWLEILDQGKREGYIDPSLSDEALLLYLDAIKCGLQNRPELVTGIPEKLQLIKELTRIMFYGFLKKEIDLFKQGG
jgi:AcrR family transcriptional regulator